MQPRLGPLLNWQWKFDSRRAGAWVPAAVSVFLILQSALTLAQLNVLPLPPGRVGFGPLRATSLFVALFSACNLASPSMEDRSSGTLGFLKIAGISPRVWVRFRSLGMILSFLRQWIFWCPIFMLIHALGGVTWTDLLWLLTSQWTVFLTVGSLAMLAARYAGTEAAVALSSLGFAFVSQILFFIPLILTGILALFQRHSFAPPDAPWALAFSQLSLVQACRSVPTTEFEWALAASSVALHLAAAWVLLRVQSRVLFVDVDTAMVVEEPAAPKADLKNNTRPSRRVTGDPLAWQACHVHCIHNLSSRVTMTVIACVAVGLLCGLVFSEPRSLAIIVGIVSLVTLAVLGFKSSDCLTRELTGGTLATLSLIPRDGREIYLGWAQGARQVAAPAYFAVALGLLVLVVVYPIAAPYWAGLIAFAVLLLPEAAFVSHVMARKQSFLDFDLTQLKESAWRLALVAGLFLIALVAGAIGGPWTAVIVFTLLALPVRRLLISNLAQLFARRVEFEQ